MKKILVLLSLILLLVPMVYADMFSHSFNYTKTNDTFILQDDINTVILTNGEGSFSVNLDYDCNYKTTMNNTIINLTKAIFNLQNGSVKCIVNNTDLTGKMSHQFTESIDTLGQMVIDTGNDIQSCASCTNDLINCTNKLNNYSNDVENCDFRISSENRDYTKLEKSYGSMQWTFIIIIIVLIILIVVMFTMLLKGGELLKK